MKRDKWVNFGSIGVTYSKKAETHLKFFNKRRSSLIDAQNRLAFSEIFAIATAKNIKELNKLLKQKNMALLSSKRCYELLGDPVKAERFNCKLWRAPVGKTIPTIPTRIYMHTSLIPYWNAVYLELRDYMIDNENCKSLGELITDVGFFNIRNQKKIVNGKLVYSKTFSLHAYGLAGDFNAAKNPMGKKPVMDKRIVNIFESNGFDWGGWWKTPDGMHFQAKKWVLEEWVKVNKIKPQL